jgi:hypothetical protein
MGEYLDDAFAKWELMMEEERNQSCRKVGLEYPELPRPGASEEKYLAATAEYAERGT